MVTKIQKELAKLSDKERLLVKEMIEKITIQNFVGLDLKKLVGQKDIYRIRKGKLRMIFSMDAKHNICILIIERRSEKTYRDF